MSIANRYLKSDDWQIGIVNTGIDQIANLEIDKPELLSFKGSSGERSFLADPFGFTLEGTLYVLCEHYRFSTGIANLVCCKVSENFALSDPAVVLDTGSHLSFPYVFSFKDDLYFCPEASASGSLSIFQMGKSPDNWRHYHTIDDSLAAIDPVIFFDGQLWWCLFSTVEHGSHSSLHARFSDALTGPWHHHALDPILIRENTARNRGTPFVANGSWHRIVQNSGRTYGGGLKLFRINEISTTHYHESEIGDFDLPLSAPYNEGFHTLSIVPDTTLAFIDAKRRTFSSRAAMNSFSRLKNKITFKTKP